MCEIAKIRNAMVTVKPQTHLFQLFFHLSKALDFQYHHVMQQEACG
jgi:hypothetical protein